MSQAENVSEARLAAKTPKGMRDWSPERMAVLNMVFPIISEVFQRHGAVPIDTPVMELKSTLTGKYGEDSKLIYDLADQGGELLSLRYDLTVPFARYLANNKISNMKRYHIAKVYRRDNPAMTRGRFREFYQCDFDIAGNYDVMMADAECIRIVCEVLDSLPVISQCQYVVKLNHRVLLDAIFEFCGVPEAKFRSICSAVDKLDKTPWDAVEDEMVEKGLERSVAKAIGEYVQQRGSMRKMIESLENSKLVETSLKAKAAVLEMTKLASYLEAMGIASSKHERVSFDLSLARGLDYYTGMILEVVVEDSNIGVGSICGGGRYDSLVGMFSSHPVPSVGFSVGIERILAIVEEKLSNTIRPKATKVLVCSVHLDKELSVKHRLEIANRLWAASIPTEIILQENPKIKRQLAYASEIGCSLAVIIGENELANSTVKIKHLSSKHEETVPLSRLEEVVGKALRQSAPIV